MKIIKYIQILSTLMSKNDKFQRMRRTGSILDLTGLITTLAGYLEPVRKNKDLSIAFTIASCGCSIGSFINFMMSLEEYGLTKEIDESEIIRRIMWNVVVMPVASSLSLAYSLKEINKIC